MKFNSKIFVTVDVVLFKKDKDQSDLVLLIKRKNEPFKDFWALPGGFVDENEGLEQAAIRELYEETFVKVENLVQVGAYGEPFRDPRSHVVSIAFTGKVDSEVIGQAADDAKELGWFDLRYLPDLAFDHYFIIHDAVVKQNL